jgi:hypothetical protein
MSNLSNEQLESFKKLDMTNTEIIKFVQELIETTGGDDILKELLLKFTQDVAKYKEIVLRETIF